MSILGGILGGMGGIISPLLVNRRNEQMINRANQHNLSLHQQQLEHNQQMWEMGRDHDVAMWERAMEHNHPAAIVERLREANLNPGMMMSGMLGREAGGTVDPMSSGQPQGQSPPQMQAALMEAQMPDIMGIVMQMQKLQTEKELTRLTGYQADEGTYNLDKAYKKLLQERTKVWKSEQKVDRGFMENRQLKYETETMRWAFQAQMLHQEYAKKLEYLQSQIDSSDAGDRLKKAQTEHTKVKERLDRIEAEFRDMIRDIGGGEEGGAVLYKILTILQSFMSRGR